ncbi:hypothetical protein B0I37DRAFT_169058 [Chaetomium sp. MPI-CAGE-AT-0009]|nr:hypothetical protein B0I37DRAFT_169058 [Chaetomium sp. MPI-CAGE-AT-0009]
MICRNIHNLLLAGPITITREPRRCNTNLPAPTSRRWLILPQKGGTGLTKQETARKNWKDPGCPPVSTILSTDDPPSPGECHICFRKTRRSVRHQPTITATRPMSSMFGFRSGFPTPETGRLAEESRLRTPWGPGPVRSDAYCLAMEGLRVWLAESSAASSLGRLVIHKPLTRPLSSFGCQLGVLKRKLHRIVASGVRQRDSSSGGQ